MVGWVESGTEGTEGMSVSLRKQDVLSALGSSEEIESRDAVLGVIGLSYSPPLESYFKLLPLER